MGIGLGVTGGALTKTGVGVMAAITMVGVSVVSVLVGITVSIVMVGVIVVAVTVALNVGNACDGSAVNDGVMVLVGDDVGEGCWTTITCVAVAVG